MTYVRDSKGSLVPSVDWSQYPDWVRERVIEKGFDPDLVVAVVLGRGALDETYVQRIDVGYLDR